MKITEKQKAIALREKGWTLNEIAKEIGCSKASVSVWVRHILLTEEQKFRITEKGRNLGSVERRRLARLSNEQKKRDEVVLKAKEDILTVSPKELMLIGAMLYLGEGNKASRGIARLTNSDPSVIKMMMRFFREVCGVPEGKFHAHIHTFENADIKKTEAYWSQVTGIPVRQFYKTYVKQSIASKHKRKTLPYGTLDIGVCDTKLFLTIMGWIEKIKELVLE